ncbi:MAG: helix-turn-helix domain-containing protein [Dorea sp.]|nr:helix-turn-helix domain-containing protein [Dorea sp.]
MKTKKVICFKLLGLFSYALPEVDEGCFAQNDFIRQKRKEYHTISGKVGKKTLSILQYLIVNHGRDVTAEELIDVFWEDRHSADPANTLRLLQRCHRS